MVEVVMAKLTDVVTAASLAALQAELDAHEALTGTAAHGLGTMSTQAASAVAITGGTITGITDLAVADGGTGASTFTAGGLLLGNGTSAISAMAAMADGVIVIGDGVGAPTTLAAFVSSTGVLKHEYGGIEADISAITTDQFLVGTSAGVIGIRTATQTRTHLGLGTAAVEAIGTSGATVPVLNGNNTHSGANIFSGANTVTGSLLFDADALRVYDTNASHYLQITPGSDLSANRILTLTTGDAARTVTISGDATISQDYSTAGTPQFTRLGIGQAAHASYSVAATNTADTSVFVGFPTHATYANSVIYLDVTRTANTAYNFIACYSGAGGDLEFKVDGVGTVSGDGALYTSPADDAELLEWEDGNPDEEDRCGLTVVAVEGTDFVRPSAPGDDPEDIIGAVSGNAAVMKGTAWSGWAKKYLRDKYNRPILCADGSRAKNPEYNPKLDAEGKVVYAGRHKRPEWAIVGTAGRVPVRNGQIVHPRWKRRAPTAADVTEWLVR